MSYTTTSRTFIANGALLGNRRAKITSGTTTIPPQVEYAGAGEQHIGVTLTSVSDGEPVAVRLRTTSGSYQVTAAGAFSVGATLYGAANGKVDDTSSGSALGFALEDATADGDIVEFLSDAVLSTTAGTVSIADSGGFTLAATVEAALAEIYQSMVSTQGFVNIPLESLVETDATNIVARLGQATTPSIDMANGDTDSGLVVTWAASNNDPILFQTALPPDFTVADVVIHFRAKSGGSTDTPTIAADSYLNEGDTKIEDVSAALSSSFAEKTITIAAADIPVGAQTLSVELTPGSHTTDTIVLSSLWLEYTRSILTA